jgi:predicted PurR-regulated permease PerM
MNQNDTASPEDTAETAETAAPVAEAAAAAPRAPPADADSAAQQRVMLHMPVDVRSLSLAILAVLASVFALQWAKTVVIPLLLGVMASYALTPVVDVLQRWRIPRALGAGVLLTGIVGALCAGAWSMSNDASALIQTLPQVAQKIRQAVQGSQRQTSAAALAKVQEAAAEIERAAELSQASSTPGAASGVQAGLSLNRARITTLTQVVTQPSRSVTRVVVEKQGLDVRDYVWTGTLGLVTFLGQFAVVLFITFFLLASGNTFRRKMVQLAGPKLSQKRVTIQALDEINGQIQRYLLVQLATSAVVGVLTWLTFLAIGLDHAAVWGVAAAVTNLIPYVGAVLLGGASALVGFIQFGALDMGLLVGAASFAIHGVIGNLMTPWWMGRAARMSPFVVFVSVLAFGWLWGVWGLLLGVPILMVVKSVCDRVDELKPIGEFLGA